MNTLLNKEQVEANRNLLDMRPALDFVGKHKAIYAANLSGRIQASKQAGDGGRALRVDSISAIGEPNHLAYLQIGQAGRIRDLLFLMPTSILEMSYLKTISFEEYDGLVVVPGFDEFGYFDRRQVKAVPLNSFPQKGEHPSRILLGQSNGETIRMMAIPPSVSEDRDAVSYFQAHVFVHEFFHSIEYPRRADRSVVKLYSHDGNSFTLEDWWQEYSNLVLFGQETEPVSFYSAAYGRDLSPDVLMVDKERYDRALAEDMAECFVAYLLDITPNSKGELSFKQRSLGGKIAGPLSGGNQKWQLMEKLFRSSVVKITS